jgi:hypothetical protein
MSSSDPKAALPARFLTAFGVAAGAAVLLVLLATWSVDPTGLLRNAGLSPGLCGGGLLSADDRYAKPLLAASHRRSEILVGSSRVAFGFDRDAFGDRPVANLGFAGADFTGVEAMVRHAAARGSVRRVWVGLDFGTFVQPGWWQEAPRPPDPREGELAIALRHGLFSRRAAAEALRSLVQVRPCLRPPLSVDGFRTDERHVFPARVNPEARQAMIDAWSIPRQLQARLLDEHLVRFDALLREMRGQGIEMIVFLSPTSPGYRSLVAQTGLTPLYARWRNALRSAAGRHDARLVESDSPAFLDSVTPPPCPVVPPDSCLFEDLTHYRPVVARAIVQAALRNGSAGDGAPPPR